MKCNFQCVQSKLIKVPIIHANFHLIKPYKNKSFERRRQYMIHDIVLTHITAAQAFPNTTFYMSFPMLFFLFFHLNLKERSNNNLYH